MDNSTETQPLTLPSKGGSYVRNGADLQRVEFTAPAKAAVGTHPTAANTPAGAGTEQAQSAGPADAEE